MLSDTFIRYYLSIYQLTDFLAFKHMFLLNNLAYCHLYHLSIIKLK